MNRAANVVLRIGVAFAFLYPPYAALRDPTSWFGYFPQVMRDAAHALSVPDPVLLHGFGLLEVGIALWVLSGKKILIPSSLATLILLAIVATNVAEFDVIFRDLTIAAASASLALEAYYQSARPA